MAITRTASLTDATEASVAVAMGNGTTIKLRDETVEFRVGYNANDTDDGGDYYTVEAGLSFDVNLPYTPNTDGRGNIFVRTDSGQPETLEILET